MTGPSDNLDVFRHRLKDEIAALLPDRQAVEGALQDLKGADIDIAQVQVLHGEEGARILDRYGEEHGFAARLGYDETILAVYDEALRRGEGLPTVPCSADRRYDVGRLLLARGGHDIIYFGANSAETLTAPQGQRTPSSQPRPQSWRTS